MMFCGKIGYDTWRMIRAKRLVVSAWLYVPVLGFVRPEKPEENQALPTIVLNSFTDEPGSVQY